jgi:hypothetical protein
MFNGVLWGVQLLSVRVVIELYVVTQSLRKIPKELTGMRWDPIRRGYTGRHGGRSWYTA